jgi:L-ascorbate metabolism protein UlaG (beta-lactamase superfamily)
MVANFEIASHLEAQGARSHGLHIGGGHQFQFGHVKLTIAHYGSTGLFLDMQLIGEAWGPLDVALLPIGDNYTIGIDDAVRAAAFLKARVCILMRYNTLDLINADPAEFVKRVQAEGHKALALAPGGTYKVE